MIKFRFIIVVLLVASGFSGFRCVGQISLPGTNTIPIRLLSTDEVYRLFTIITDHAYGESERYVFTNRNRHIGKLHVGGGAKLTRTFAIPGVLSDDGLESEMPKLMKAVTLARRQVIALGPPSPWNRDQLMAANAALKTATNKVTRFEEFRLKHNEADKFHRVAVVFEAEAIDMVNVRFFWDIDISLEVKSWIYWTVEEGRFPIKLHVADFKGGTFSGALGLRVQMSL